MAGPLPDDALDALLAALAARDGAPGYDVRLVEQATTSLTFGIAAGFADRWPAEQLGARLLERARAVPADRPGALAARAAVLTRFLAGPELRYAPRSLAGVAATRGGARGTRGFGALLLLEVQAYDVQVHCATEAVAGRNEASRPAADGRSRRAGAPGAEMICPQFRGVSMIA